MAWRAFVRGGKFDLDLLCAQFSDGRVRVANDGVEHWIEADEFADLTSAEEVRAAADKVLTLMNGTARLIDFSHAPVELVGRFDDGKGTHVVLLGDAVTMRVGVSFTASGEVRDADGNLVPPLAPPGVSYLALAQSNAHVEELVQILSGPQPDWVELYKVWEIIETDVGGEKQIVANGWASKDEPSDFGMSANHPGVSGRDARHARMKGTPRKPGMDIHAGREFIRRLATHWMDDKLQQP